MMERWRAQAQRDMQQNATRFVAPICSCNPPLAGCDRCNSTRSLADDPPFHQWLAPALSWRVSSAAGLAFGRSSVKLMVRQAGERGGNEVRKQLAQPADTFLDEWEQITSIAQKRPSIDLEVNFAARSPRAATRPRRRGVR